jgi:hypothetical protein
MPCTHTSNAAGSSRRLPAGEIMPDLTNSQHRMNKSTYVQIRADAKDEADGKKAIIQRPLEKVNFGSIPHRSICRPARTATTGKEARGASCQARGRQWPRTNRKLLPETLCRWLLEDQIHHTACSSPINGWNSNLIKVGEAAFSVRIIGRMRFHWLG